MKNKKHKNAKNGLGLFVLFIECLAITFAGFCLCNILAITINCIFDGFNSFFGRVMELPFLLYLIFSFVISAVLVIIIQRKINCTIRYEKQYKGSVLISEKYVFIREDKT